MTVQILQGDAREVLAGLPARCIHACITSPPYFGLRSYNGGAMEIGTEGTPQQYVAALVQVFRGVHRVLRDEGTLWLVLGDSYAAGGLGAAPSPKSTLQKNGANGRSPYLDALATGASRRPPAGVRAKNLLGIPWRVAFALQDDGWLLRQEVIWAKPNPMPESVKDRCTRAHETVFMLAKGPRYFYDQDAIREPHSSAFYRSPGPVRDRGVQVAYRGNAPRIQLTKERTGHVAGRNKRTVWTVATSPLNSKKFGCDTEHYAAFPPELVRPMVRAATSERGVCSQCSAPWRRVVERSAADDRVVQRTRNVGGRSDGFTRPKASGGLPPVDVQTTGWQPGCACEAGPPIPCTTLDPFLGSGTVALVSKGLGRSCIGIELNPAYAEMARRRVESVPYTLFSAATITAETEAAAR